MITGRTKVLAVIGNPVAHSLSPVFQNAGIKAVGADYVYTALPVEEESLGAAIAGMRAMGICGINVTIPHKENVMKYLDSIDEDAKVLGAVNTIVNKAGVLTGYNTDVNGFLAALNEFGFMPEECNATVLGAGGAARAVIWGLCKRKAAHIAVGVRNPEKYKNIKDKTKMEEIALMKKNSNETNVTGPSIIRNFTPGTPIKLLDQKKFSFDKCVVDGLFFNNKEEIYEAKCGHLYHKNCFNKLLKEMEESKDKKELKCVACQKII